MGLGVRLGEIKVERSMRLFGTIDDMGRWKIDKQSNPRLKTVMIVTPPLFVIA